MDLNKRGIAAGGDGAVYGGVCDAGGVGTEDGGGSLMMVLEKLNMGGEEGEGSGKGGGIEIPS